MESNVSVDESMIPYFGKHSCKQFLRNKPVRFGYKAWVAALKYGYCLQFDIYQGKRQDRDPLLGLGESVVLHFSKTIANEFPSFQFSFFFDNFFSSPDLLHKLSLMGFGGTGTLRENRLKNLKLEDKKEFLKKDRGYFTSYYDKETGQIVTRWKDKKVVTMVSNVYGTYPVKSAKRFSFAEKRKIDIPQPNVNYEYNSHMGGVDLLDEHISCYRIGFRGKKWYTSIVMWMIDLAIVNAWSLSKHCGKGLDQLEFRRQLAIGLLKTYGYSPTRSGRPKTQDLGEKVTGQHLIITGGNKIYIFLITWMITENCLFPGLKRKRCRLCKSQTNKICSQCKIALHDKCFVQFHTNDN